MAGMPYPPIVCTVSFVGAVLALASGKAERRQLHPLVGCKKCIDFFVVTKFRCIFAM